MMKKINNKKTITFYIGILTILLIILLFSGIILFLLKPSKYYTLLLLLCGGVFSIILYTFLKLKTFEFENSLQVITIRQAFFWKVNPAISPIEFPNNMLFSFKIRKGIFATHLMLAIKSQNHKRKTIYCEITGLNNLQIVELERSLSKAKEYAE